MLTEDEAREVVLAELARDAEALNMDLAISRVEPVSFGWVFYWCARQDIGRPACTRPSLGGNAPFWWIERTSASFRGGPAYPSPSRSRTMSDGYGVRLTPGTRQRSAPGRREVQQPTRLVVTPMGREVTQPTALRRSGSRHGSEGSGRRRSGLPGPSLGRARLLNSGSRRPTTAAQANRGTARTSESAGRRDLEQDPEELTVVGRR